MGVFSLIALTLVMVLCCRRQRKLILLKLGQQMPKAPLKTFQDETGIIQPDVMFYSTPIGDPGAAAALVPATLVGAVVHSVAFAPEPTTISTPIRPLHPAYQASQPIQIKNNIRYLRNLSEDLSLPPGYLQHRLKLQSQMTPVQSA